MDNESLYRHVSGRAADGSSVGDELLAAQLEPEEGKENKARSVAVTRHFLSAGIFGSEKANWGLRHVLIGFSVPIIGAKIALIPYIGPMAPWAVSIGVISYLGMCASGLAGYKKGTTLPKYFTNAITALFLVITSLILSYTCMPEAWADLFNPVEVSQL